MKKAIKDLLGSKKFLVSLSAAISAAVMRLGFDIPQETVLAIVGPLAAYVVGQGVADHGKERGKL